MASTLKRKDRIVIVAAGQPSANPRLIKEATLLSKNNYEVTVIYCITAPWADVFDNELIKNNPQIDWIKVGYHSKKNSLFYFKARIKRKVYEYLCRIIGIKSCLAEGSLFLFNDELKIAAALINADMYIGHNLGALSAVVNAAQKHRAKVVFDFEDYYRGMNHSDSFQNRIARLVEEKYIPYLSCATAASPLIAKVYDAHFSSLAVYTINNYFPHEYAPNELSVLPISPLRLFWFSQFVGRQRGLEQVIEAIGKTGSKEIYLTLLGNCSYEMKHYLLNEAQKHQLSIGQLQFVTPVAEKDIVKIASQHHIGLAVEIPYNENRQLCLTNKIFMYLLAGNTIIFSNTKAQKDFFDSYRGIGSIFQNGDILALASILELYLNNNTLLNQHRELSFNLGKSFNWEIEKIKYLELIKKYI